jgi:hypothetical protein
MKKPHPLVALFFAFVAVSIIGNELAAAAVAQLAQLPDPIARPVEAVDTVTALWRSGAIVASIIVGSYVVLAFASRTWPWLTQGRRAVYSAAALGFLSTLVSACVDGSPPDASVVVVALASSVALVMSNKPSELLPVAKVHRERTEP